MELNSIELTDPLGDNGYLMISLPYESSQITIGGEENSTVISKITTEEGARFKISINELSKITGREPGDLSGLMLKLPVNKMMLIPHHKGKETSGIPLEIWTEASVASDINNERFDLMKTEPVTAWIKLYNKSPTFNSAEVITIQKDEVQDGKVLLSLDDLFTDADNNDLKIFEILPSDEIKDFIILDKDSNELKLIDISQTTHKLPDGLHRIGIRMKDSSGVIGDRSGFASGQIRLLVKSNTDDTGTVSGLNLLSTIDDTGISNMLEISNDKLDNEQIQLKSILQELSVIPNIEPGNEFSTEDIQNAKRFISQIQKGSTAVLRNNDIKSEGLLVLESENEDNILINSAINMPNSDVLNISESLLGLKSDKIIEAPIGELDFAIDTQGQDNAVVNIQLPNDVNIDFLVKTRENGDPFKFHTQKIEYNETLGDIDSWISELKYSIYDYSISETNPEVVLELTPTQSIQEQLASIGFQNEIIKNLDGSAFLIDTDNDGRANILSMMLLDQGWFDTLGEEIGLIGDPLTPIELDSLDRSQTDTPNVTESKLPFMSTQSTGGVGENNNSKELPFIDKNMGSDVINKATSNEYPDSRNLLGLNTNKIQPLEYPENDFYSKNEDDVGRIRESFSPFEEKRRRPLQKAISSILGNINNIKPEKTISPVISLFMIGFGIERLSQSTLKSARLPKNLKLSRRSDDLRGHWLIPTRNQENIEITSKESRMMLNKINDSKNENQQPRQMLPGFDKNGNSWLYSSIQLSSYTGELIVDIETKFYQMVEKSNIDINWVDWIDKYFAKEIANNYRANSKYRDVRIFKLRQLIQNYQDLEPAMADVVMIGQLYNCCEQLGIHRINGIANNKLKG